MAILRLWEPLTHQHIKTLITLEILGMLGAVCQTQHKAKYKFLTVLQNLEQFAKTETKKVW
jgi:hypothetical protein